MSAASLPQDTAEAWCTSISVRSFSISARMWERAASASPASAAIVASLAANSAWYSAAAARTCKMHKPQRRLHLRKMLAEPGHHAARLLTSLGTPSGRAKDHHPSTCADVGRLVVRNSIQNMALRSSRTRGVRPSSHVGSKPTTLI